MRYNISRFLFFRLFLAASVMGGCVLILLLVFLFVERGNSFYLWVSIGGMALFVLSHVVIYKHIYKPHLETQKMLDLFLTGYTLNSVFELRYPYTPQMEQAIIKLKDFIDTNELLNASKRQAQYLALQNQINPHFLYNTLEGIRSEALSAGLESVAEMTEALARFFRYTISNLEHLVSLEDELSNVENYFIIQQYRFGSRLELSVEFIDPEDSLAILACKLPKLTLQPIVENAIIHGIERKVGIGRVRLKLEITGTLLLITISDNGMGMDEVRLQNLIEHLNTASVDYMKSEKGGIAIVNVNRRIQLLFGEQYGMGIYSTQGVGTDVEITLPLISDAWEKAIQ